MFDSDGSVDCDAGWIINDVLATGTYSPLKLTYRTWYSGLLFLFSNVGVDRAVVADECVDDWLSSFDDGHGDVHVVDEISDDDSSDVEDNEPDRGVVSELCDNVKLLNNGRGVFVGSWIYWN